MRKEKDARTDACVFCRGTIMQKTEFAHKRELFKAILDKNELAVCEYL